MGRFRAQTQVPSSLLPYSLVRPSSPLYYLLFLFSHPPHFLLLPYFHPPLIPVPSPHSFTSLSSPSHLSCYHCVLLPHLFHSSLCYASAAFATVTGAGAGGRPQRRRLPWMPSLPSASFPWWPLGASTSKENNA